MSVGKILAQVLASGVEHPLDALDALHRQLIPSPTLSTRPDVNDCGVVNFLGGLVSDAVRILYVLVSVAGSARQMKNQWVSFDTLRDVCCQGDQLRLLGALKDLRVARLAAVNADKRKARSHIQL
jgi:hypothetical protein